MPELEAFKLLIMKHSRSPLTHKTEYNFSSYFKGHINNVTVKPKNILSICEEGAKTHTEADHVVEGKMHLFRFGLSILYFLLFILGKLIIQ